MEMDVHFTPRRPRSVLLLGIGACAMALMNASGCSETPPLKDSANSVTSSRTIDQFLAERGLSGTIVLAEFCSVGCERSGTGLDTMIDMHRRGALPGTSYIVIDGSANGGAADEYYAAKAPPFPVVRNPHPELLTALGARVYPQFLLLGRYGHIRYSGPLPELVDLREWVDVLAEETADPGAAVARFGETTLDVPSLLAATRLPDREGSTHSLAEFRTGRALLILFVDSTCPFSQSTVGELPRVWRELAAQDIATLLVFIRQSKDEVEEALASDLDLPPIVYDQTGRTQLTWHITSVPTLYLIDADGGVAYTGPALWAQVAAAAEELLELKDTHIEIEAEGTEYG
jgi:hypothetical protein